VTYEFSYSAKQMLLAIESSFGRSPTNKVRSCERSEPRSEPFVGQARSRSAGFAAQKISLWKLSRFEVVPGRCESEDPFYVEHHDARKRMRAVIGLSSRIACEPMPQLTDAELPMRAKVRDVYMVTVLPGWESGRGPRTRIESGS
jgi:hypothetical protein